MIILFRFDFLSLFSNVYMLYFFRFYGKSGMEKKIPIYRGIVFIHTVHRTYTHQKDQKKTSTASCPTSVGGAVSDDGERRCSQQTFLAIIRSMSSEKAATVPPSKPSSAAFQEASQGPLDQCFYGAFSYGGGGGVCSARPGIQSTRRILG